MQIQKIKEMSIAIFLIAFFSVLGMNHLKDLGQDNSLHQKTIEDPEFRRDFFSDSMRENQESLSEECKTFLTNVENDVDYFPIPESTVDKSLKFSYTDGWMSERTYKGKRGHEGTDIMASTDKRGIYPVLSMTDGVVTSLGWLDKGGWRVGISSNSGIYYYYAHLDAYANIKEGQEIKAGELLGYMGDSGYGPEGTKGQFAVHLHVGIYSYTGGKEVSVNPYYVLRYLEDRILEYEYSEFSLFQTCYRDTPPDVIYYTLYVYPHGYPVMHARVSGWTLSNKVYPFGYPVMHARAGGWTLSNKV